MAAGLGAEELWFLGPYILSFLIRGHKNYIIASENKNSPSSLTEEGDKQVAKLGAVHIIVGSSTCSHRLMSQSL
jgi:hypothetical protein